MRQILLATLMTALIPFTGKSQELTIISPDIQEPYEVAAGTDVTFQWSYGGDPPTAVFSYDQEPELNPFNPNSEWTQHTNYVDNGDGTYNVTITIDEPTWVWGGQEPGFIGQWAYSEVLEIGISSGVIVNADDALLCQDGSDTEELSLEESYDSYQWYLNDAPINGATSSSYIATEAGAYKVEVPLEGEDVFSNTVHIEYPELEFSGELVSGGAELEMTATEGLDSYQWLSGNSEEELSPIPGATGNTHTVAVEGTSQYYAVSGSIAGCELETNAAEVSNEVFSSPEITVNADTNSFGNVCAGNSMTLSTSEGYGSYTWYSGDFEYTTGTTTITINNTFGEGDYTVEVTPSDWPGINLESEIATVDFFELTEPVLTGVDNTEKHCPGDELAVTLGDEGYNYTWYLHSEPDYSEEDEIEVDGYSYSFTFENTVWLTVEASSEGCSTSNTLYIQSYETLGLPMNPDSYTQQYLCPDSSITLQVPGYAQDDYTNLQWYEVVDGENQAISGATGFTYDADATGTYLVQADAAECPAISLESSEFQVYEHTERNLNIFADSEAICMDEETTINISGGQEWINIQWFEEYIDFGDGGGYDEFLAPIPGGGSEETIAVSEFNTYAVKARHESCPNGDKITSNLLEIGPKVNPDLVVNPNYGVEDWRPAPYDSIPSYLFCTGQPVILSVEEEYDNYTWFRETYAGDDDYQLGDEIENAEGSQIEEIAEGAYWVTAQVDSAGCIGVSDPVLIDTWVFQSPAIASYNNSELCEEGDSTLMHVAFAGNWIEYEWFHNGDLIPNSNNDTLYASEPGMYTVTTYPEQCPDFGYSSGVGPIVSFLEALIQQTEDQIYALPQEGFYEYQWYLDGEPIEGGDPVWTLDKDSMEDGVYTVEVTNPEPCTSLSGAYVWDTSSLSEISGNTIEAFPNPASEYVRLEGVSPTNIDDLKMYDSSGRTIPIEFSGNSPQIDLSGLESGVYVIELVAGQDNARLRVVKR